MRKGCLSFLLPIFVCLFAIPAFASGATHSTVSMHLLRPGAGAVGDLDGDHIPDIASGINTGHTSQGYSYRVDLDLSGNSGAGTLSLFSEDSSGQNIEAVDIDGDHDLDLIMTHYADAVELTSPIAAQLLGTADGKVVGKARRQARRAR